MKNYMDYKIAFVVLLSVLTIIILFPFVYYFITTKICNNNRVMDLPNNNLPV